MGRNDMNHMQHLESVVLSDCAVLQTKEATYQGSWKRAGGRSAWFMARRNMDRLLTMMPAKPVENDSISTFENIRGTLMGLKEIVHRNQDPLGSKLLPGSIDASMAILDHVLDSYTADDVFARIAERPKGEDGTVLACIRDLRRYFVLVEAEMIAEGVVEPESKTYEQETKMYCPPETDVYQMIADEKGLTREVVKELIHRLFYSNPPPIPASNGGYAAEQAARHVKPWHDKTGALLRPGDACTWHSPDNRILEVVFRGVIDDKPLLEVEGVADANVIAEWRDLRRDGTKENRALAISDGGSQHAEQNPLWPWQATKNEHAALRQRHGNIVDLFYSQRAIGVYQLESVVGSKNLPKELAAVYHYAGEDKWTLRRGLVPEDLADNFPLCQLEKNTKELEESHSDFKFMYEYTESDQKWRLKREFSEWGRGV